MRDETPGEPLARRRPGASRATPRPRVPRPLPDALLAKMQAAVDAARIAQASSPADAEPITEPIPRMQAATSAHVWSLPRTDEDKGPLWDAANGPARPREKPFPSGSPNGSAGGGADRQPGTAVNGDQPGWGGSAVGQAGRGGRG